MNSFEALERLFGNYVSSKCYGINYKQDDENYNIIKQDLERLELIKCLEKRLGIDLFILFGALRNGIYYKSFDGDIDYLSARVLTLSYSLGFDIWVTGHRKFDGLLIDFKDYGKIWGLTKEELQNE